MRAEQGQKNSDEIKRDIAHTRHEMDETVNEIQRRLRPEHLRRQARDTVRDTFRETAQGASNRMLNTIKENPVPSLIAGLSIGWLVAKSSSSSERRRYYEDEYRDAYSRRYGVQGEGYGGPYREEYYREPYGPAGYDEYYGQERQYEDYEGAYEGESERRSAGERAGEAADQARETVDQARETAQRYRRRAQRQARRATHRLEHWMEDNPLAVGAATFALGAVAGLALPSTRWEDEVMGETRDRVLHQAQSTAKEAAQRAQHVAEEAAEEAAEDAKETAKEEAQKEKKKAEERRS